MREHCDTFPSFFHYTMPKPFSTGIGIDVSKKELVIALRRTEKTELLSLPNTKEGIRKLKKAWKGFECPIILESTGRYHLLAALELSEAGFHVCVINPLMAKKYTTSSIRKIKTDSVDAQRLAEMAEREGRQLPLFRYDRNTIALRQKLGLLQSVEKQIQSSKRSLKNFQEARRELCLPKSSAEELLEISVQKLEESVRQLVSEIENIPPSEDAASLSSIPGVSSFLASLLLQFLDLSVSSSKQWVAFIGLDVSVKQSGMWKGKGKLTKRGNPYLRKRLFSAAWGAMMSHPLFRKEYDHLREQGRSYRAALIILARKILRIAFSVLKNHTSYSDSLAFSS